MSLFKLKIFVSAVMTLVALSFVSTAWSQDVTLRLQEKLNRLRAYQAAFQQKVKSNGRVIQRSRGTMAIQRPGKFRWYSQTPMKQLIVADGKHLWVFDQELEQVTVKPQKKGLGGTPALFLSGYDDTVSRDFNVSLTEKNRIQRFELLPKNRGASFQRVVLIYQKERLTGIELKDKLDQVTEVKFYRIKVNPSLSSTLFQFKPPKGTDVIKEG